MRTRLTSYRLTPIGAILLAVLIGAIVTFAVGPPSAEKPILIIAVVVFFALVQSIFFGAAGTRNEAERREDFAAQRAPENENADPAAEAQAWQRERQRYQRRG
jgi:type VI protein secretion system component VasK